MNTYQGLLSQYFNKELIHAIISEKSEIDICTRTINWFSRIWCQIQSYQNQLTQYRYLSSSLYKDKLPSFMAIYCNHRRKLWMTISVLEVNRETHYYVSSINVHLMKITIVDSIRIMINTRMQVYIVKYLAVFYPVA